MDGMVVLSTEGEYIDPHSFIYVHRKLLQRDIFGFPPLSSRLEGIHPPVAFKAEMFCMGTFNISLCSVRSLKRSLVLDNYPEMDCGREVITCQHCTFTRAQAAAGGKTLELGAKSVWSRASNEGSQRFCNHTEGLNKGLL